LSIHSGDGEKGDIAMDMEAIQAQHSAANHKKKDKDG